MGANLNNYSRCPKCNKFTLKTLNTSKFCVSCGYIQNKPGYSSDKGNTISDITGISATKIKQMSDSEFEGYADL